ncbi:MAG: LPS assembly lipoprotein LptE [Candidatus Methylomirabilales bacterium]
MGTLSHPRSLAIAPFTNATFRPHLQGALASAILEVLRRDPRIALAKQEAADLLLEGTIAAYANDGIGFDQKDIARRFRLRILLQAVLKERKSGVILAKEELSGEAFYTAGAEVVATQAAEEEAMARAVLDLAERVHLLIITGLLLADS